MASLTSLPLTSHTKIFELIGQKKALYFQIPADAKVKTGYPGAKDYSITVVASAQATMLYDDDGMIVISAKGFVSGASDWCSPLALWTGAAGAASMLSGGRHIDRAVLGTTAVIAASSLMNVAFAGSGSGVEIYFNLPNYVRYSQFAKPSNSAYGKQQIAFVYAPKRSAVPQPFKVKGGTCALGQCGGPGTAGITGCQCDSLCTQLGDCCSDYSNSCETVANGDVLNRLGTISVFSSLSGRSSCKNRCGGSSLDGSCLCDDRCHLTNDCCTDKDYECPASDKLAVACKCSGKKNAGLPVGQQGGAECKSPNETPKGNWCYTDKGLCSDGQASKSLTDQDWSVLACAKTAAPPVGGGGVVGGTSCKCTPGVVNAQGAGGAACTSKDTDGPSPGDTLDAWCYTEANACTDGKASAAVPGKEYSYKACNGVKPPGGGGRPAPPAGWKCAAAVYAARDSCDCNCGVPDPDCQLPGIKVTNCLGGQVCSTQGQCQNAPNPGTGGGGGNAGVRGASLGCTAGSPAGSPGTRRRLEFLPRIVGGTAVNPPFKQKHLVSLQRTSGFHFCGGSLIYDGTWVLSAAHCLQGAAYGQVPPNLGQVVLHRHDLRVPLAQESAAAMKPFKVYNHKAYNPGTSANDIALIKLASPANPGQPMTRAEVPQNMLDNIIKMDDGSFAKEDQLVTVAGWGALASGGGSPPTARQVTVQYITNAKCQTNGGQAGTQNAYKGKLDSSMLCAGQKNGAPGKDSCQGDSGGPLTTSCMINGKPRAVLVGVVSWGFGCALANLPGVYARVNQFIPWMQSIIGANPNSFNG